MTRIRIDPMALNFSMPNDALRTCRLPPLNLNADPTPRSDRRHIDKNTPTGDGSTLVVNMVEDAEEEYNEDEPSDSKHATMRRPQAEQREANFEQDGGLSEEEENLL